MKLLFITKFCSFSIKNLLLFIFTLGVLTSCEPKSEKKVENVNLKAETKIFSIYHGYPQGEVLIDHTPIQVVIAHTPQQQVRGLSGLPSDDFGPKDAMLFFNKVDAAKSFWMPDTYFDLDIFFLDKDYKIVDVEKKVPAHPGMQEPPTIPRTRTIYARHVFEMRADSSYSQKLKIGDQLQWKSPPQL